MRRLCLRRVLVLATLLLSLATAQTAVAEDSSTPPKYFRPKISSQTNQTFHSLAARDATTYDVLLIEDLAPWASTSNEDLLNANGITYKKISISDVATEKLSKYKKIILAGDQTTSFYSSYMSKKSIFDSYVKRGGKLEWHLCGFGWNKGDSSSVVLPGGVSMNGLSYFLDYNYIGLPSHALVSDVSSPFWSNFASHGYFTNFAGLPGLDIITTEGPAEGYWPTLVQYPYGKGCVVASSQPLEYGHSHSEATGKILSNMIPYYCSALPSGKGYVVTIDGTHIMSMLVPSYPPDPTHYLYDAIDSYWSELIGDKIGTITHFDWSRNIYGTDNYVFMLSAVLEGFSKLSQKNHVPLVILSHSWGTVLAYIAMSQNTHIVVDKFITLGSPLNAQNETVNAFTKETLARWHINKVSSLKKVKKWNNYWAQCDPISGSVNVKKVNNIEITTDYIDNTLGTCHAAYFEDYGIWQQILMDVYITK